ncbi:unnamed protein product [Sphagnum tenellum]
MRSDTSNAAQNSGGELPLLGLHQSSARTSGTSHGRSQIVGSWRAKCSSSRSLYYADGYEELEASSRNDVRRSASTLYRTDVDSEYFELLQPPPRRSRLHANNKSRISRLSKQPATSCSTSSPQLTSKTLTPLRVESARGRIAGWSLPIYSTELPAAATRDEEIRCPGSRNKQEEQQQQQQADEDDHDHETEEQQLQEEEEEEAGKKKNYVWKKNVHEIVCQSCGMEVAVSEAFVNLELKQQQQLRRRRRSSRAATVGSGPDQRGDENSSLVEEEESSLKFASCEDGIEDLQLRDDEKRSAAAPPSTASWKPAAGGRAGAASQSLEEIYMTPATSCEQDRSAAVPFKWEDAPGKPKTTTTTTQKAKARCRLSREQSFEFNSFVEEGEIVLSRSAATASATVLTTDQQGSGSSRQESGSCELKSTRSLRDQTRAAVGERSHRYYGDQVAAAVHRREKSLQEKETTTHIIDLVAPAAAKFLVQETSCYLSPVATPLHHRASFASPGAVPFKWEETPGKPKADAEETSSKPHSLLQLPPRLAIPQQQRAPDIGSSSSSSFFSARDLRAHYLPNYSSLSGPLVGFFSPCLTSACNAQARPRLHAVHHSSFSPFSSSYSSSSSYKLGSKSLPRKLSPSSSPPPVNSPALRKRSAFSAPLASSSSPTGGLQPRICYSSEELLKAAAASSSSSHPCKNNVVGVGGRGGGYAEAPSPPPAAGTVMMNSSSSTPSSSIFHDRPEAESLSQTSGSKPAASSGYFLDALTRPTSFCTPSGASSSSLHVRSKSSSSSSSSSQASYESVEQEFDQEEEEEEEEEGGGEHAAATRSPTRYISGSRRHHRLPPPLDSRCCDHNSLGGGSSAAAAASTGMKALIIKLCRNGNCFNSCSSSEEARAPSTLLATYFHNCMEPNQNSILSSELDEHKRSSRSSAAAAAATATTAVASPIPLTRLPYTMPSVAEQELAARQLQHKPPPPPNPDFAARLGGATTITKLIPPVQTGAKTCNPAAATMMSAQCEKTLQLQQLSCNNATHYSVNCCCYRDDEVSSASPAYATALEMLSPAMNFMPQQSRCKSSTAAFVAASSSSAARTRKTASSTTCRWTGPKVRHRVRFIFSMCKALKRVLFKQRHRKVVVEPNFWYHDEIPLTEFQFVKPTEY